MHINCGPPSRTFLKLVFTHIELGTRTSQVALVVKILPANAGDIRDAGLTLGLGRSPGGGHGNPAFLPGESHGQRNLSDYSP